ncbi:hypothetical protein GCM10027299_25300 [Larkinella ripae]
MDLHRNYTGYRGRCRRTPDLDPPETPDPLIVEILQSLEPLKPDNLLILETAEGLLPYYLDQWGPSTPPKEN